ncbi:MAG: UDP-N-acetylmuramoyl-tripeptide--D-alanyl-D-alanine ligase [Deltaproteobacteria bacterium]|jgi:UDP-N-acetylmuramoyl-tripeptide--D-alanyl-D-alanine ligase|nr:UDP-N-acetylmuramoyl-tripeptide--D-alanyl-D-alanine ligase [Deltaproteobacteria bacterium]
MMTLREMAQCLGALESSGTKHTHWLPESALDRAPARFCLDSREVGPDDVFICLHGENVDGHDFARQAAERGALALIAEKDPQDIFDGETPPLAVLRVESSLAAITALASAWRERAASAGTVVVGVTGTAGKTSVKEALAAVLERHGKTAKNFMNMNNQLGLPVNMLNAPADAVFWVMEAGINEAHDMDELGALLRPDLAVILNVGPGHLSGLGGPNSRGVPYYKSRLLAYVNQAGPCGRALINADYPDLLRESRSYALPQSLFSTKRADADYRASYVGPVSTATGKYQVQLREADGSLRTFDVAAPFRGSFGSENVAAIAGAAHILGLSPEEITAGLAQAAMPRQRFSCRTYKNTMVIDDSYNSNPLSASRMLEAAVEMAAEKKLPLFLVMGEMLELGEEAEEIHLQLGRNMAKTGAKLVLWKGGQADSVREGLKQGDFTGEFKVTQELNEFLDAICSAHKQAGACGVVLFKGSRGNRLERFVAGFQNELGKNL